jgi:hypothetical protein
MAYYMGDYYRGDYYRGDSAPKKKRRKRTATGGARRGRPRASGRAEHPFAKKMRLARARARGGRR